MSVGMFDCDWYSGIHEKFNLELMKLATYYKRKNQIVSLSPGFYPESYTKFIMRQDFENDTYFSNITDYPNLEYGGYTYSNGLYVPLDPEIELLVPDASIYNKVPVGTSRQETHIYNGQLRGMHARLSLDGQTIWEDFTKPLQRLGQGLTLTIHDKNLSQIKDYKEGIKELIKIFNHKRVSIYFPYPVQVSTIEELVEIFKLGKLSEFSSVQFNGFLSDEEFVYLTEVIEPYNLEKLLYNVVLPDNISNQDFLNLITKIFY